MCKSKYSESQIVRTLKEVEGGRQVKDVCRELGISEATYYVWRSKYGGMEAADVRRLKELEEENAKLKRMYAELALENNALKDVIAKNCRPGGEAPAGGRVDGRARSERAPGLSGGGHRPLGGALCVAIGPG
jgi:putative transposase